MARISVVACFVRVLLHIVFSGVFDYWVASARVLSATTVILYVFVMGIFSVPSLCCFEGGHFSVAWF